jgi:hypothetical protein
VCGGQQARFTLAARDDRTSELRGLPFTATLSVAGQEVAVTRQEKGDGSHEFSFTAPEVEDDVTGELWVRLCGMAVARSPRSLTVQAKLLLTFSAPFDENGVLYHIGTAGGKEPYKNPHEAGRVVAAMSTSGAHQQLHISSCAARFVEHISPSKYNYTNNAPNSWMSVDLGESRTLQPNYYCLRNDKHGSHALRNWRLEGSHDGCSWVALRTHESDNSLATTSMSTAAWPLEGVTQAFRHFRILQTGKSAYNRDYLMCAGIELYGIFKE